MFCGLDSEGHWTIYDKPRQAPCSTSTSQDAMLAPKAARAYGTAKAKRTDTRNAPSPGEVH